MKYMKKMLLFAAPVLLAAVSAPVSWSGPQTTDRGELVRRELNKLPFITVFDRIEYEVTGDAVRLTGSVLKPWNKTDAEQLVSRIPGVSNVVNEIEVLPLSRFDNQIRLNAYRLLFNRNSTLQRYRIGSNAPIRIIVRNGHLALEGFVGSEFDKRVAEILARQVPNTFSVTNNLRIG